MSSHRCSNRTNLFETKTFLPPPRGFDPLTASKRLLIKYGFPSRPDRIAARTHCKAWELYFSRKFKHIVPSFEISSLQSPQPTKKMTLEDIYRDGESSGIVAFSHNDPYKWVWGTWSVPKFYTPDTDGARYFGSTWIGIDGYSENDILQAGTDVEIVNKNGRLQKSMKFWWAWHPAYKITIENFPVSPLDRIYCLICATRPGKAYIYLSNENRLSYTSFKITAPQEIFLMNISKDNFPARPDIETPLYWIAEKNEVYFSNCCTVTKGQPDKFLEIVAPLEMVCEDTFSMSG